MFIEHNMSRNRNISRNKIISNITFCTRLESKKNTLSCFWIKFGSTLNQAGNKTKRTKSFQIKKSWWFMMQKFKRRFVLKDWCRQSVDNVSGMFNSIAPENMRHMRMKQQAASNIHDVLMFTLNNGILLRRFNA